MPTGKSSKKNRTRAARMRRPTSPSDVIPREFPKGIEALKSVGADIDRVQDQQPYDPTNDNPRCKTPEETPELLTLGPSSSLEPTLPDEGLNVLWNKYPDSKFKEFWNPEDTYSFRILRIPLTEEGLKDLKSFIGRPKYALWIRQVCFDCNHVRTKSDQRKLMELILPMTEIVYLISVTMEKASMPIRYSLTFLLAGLMFAISDNENVWMVWNGPSRQGSNRSQGMDACCVLTNDGIGVDDPGQSKHEVHIDWGLKLGTPTLTSMQTDRRLCVLRGLQGGTLLVKNWPPKGLRTPNRRPDKVKPDCMRIDLRNIVIEHTTILLGGLHYLLERNKQTLRKLVLCHVDTVSHSIT